MSGYRHHYGRPTCGPGPAWVVAGCAVFVLLAVAIVGAIHATGTDQRDLERLNELRAEHGAVKNKLLTLPKPSSERPRLESRLRAVTAEHNAILSRHPTWNLRPLDTLFIDL